MVEESAIARKPFGVGESTGSATNPAGFIRWSRPEINTSTTTDRSLHHQTVVRQVV